KRHENHGNRGSSWIAALGQHACSDYLPANIAALNFWGRAINDRWNADDLQLNEHLLAYSWSRFHLLYAIQLFFAAASKIDKVPLPSATIQYPDPNALINFAASCYNSALMPGWMGMQGQLRFSVHRIG